MARASGDRVGRAGARGCPMLPLLLALSTGAPAAEPDPAPPVEELLRAVDDAHRGEASHATFTMRVETDRIRRTLKLEAVSKGTDKSLITILAPPKDAGIRTLKVGDNLWNYLPKIDRVMKIPSGMMGGSWMGSHFTNDDLVRASRLSEDYTATLVQAPDAEHPDRTYRIELRPKPGVPVVWGKIDVELSPDRLPLVVRSYDEHGALVRTLRYGDVQTIEGREVPMRMRLEPADHPGAYTEIVFESLTFEPAVDDKTFSLQALKHH